MKKIVSTAFLFFILSFFFGNAHRFLNGSATEMIHPFILRSDIQISKQWYFLFLGDQISYSFLWLLIISIVKPMMEHSRDVLWAGTNPYFVFSRLWYRILLLCFIASVLDTLHFLLFFKKNELWFLVQIISFSIICAVLIFKSYIKKWKVFKKINL